MSKHLTVGDLRRRLDGVDDDVIVVAPASDHSYRVIRMASEATAIKWGQSELCEDYDDELDSDQERISVLVVE